MANTRNFETGLVSLIVNNCRSRVRFVHELKVKGLLGIVADHSETTWIDVNETFVTTPNKPDVGPGNALQLWKQNSPLNMPMDMQMQPPRPRATNALPLPVSSPVQPREARLKTPQLAARPRMRSPGVMPTPRLPSAMRPSQVKLQKLPSNLVRAGPPSASVIANGAGPRFSAPANVQPRASNSNGSAPLSSQKMAREEQHEGTKDEQDSLNNGSVAQMPKPEEPDVKATAFKPTKAATKKNQSNTASENTGKKEVAKVAGKKVTKRNATKMPELMREEEDDPLLPNGADDKQSTSAKTNPKSTAKRSKMETTKDFVSDFI